MTIEEMVDFCIDSECEGYEMSCACGDGYCWCFARPIEEISIEEFKERCLPKEENND